MKWIYLLAIIFYCSACNHTKLFKGKEVVIKEFPQTIDLKGKKINLEILGINNLYVADTFLFAYTAQQSEHYFKIYSTNNYRYLGDFIPVGRGPNEFYGISYFNCYHITPQSTSIWLQNALAAYRWNVTESIKQDTTVIDSVIPLKGVLAEGCWLHGNKKLVKISLSKNNLNYQMYDHIKNKILIDKDIFLQKLPRRLMSLTNMDYQLRPNGNQIVMTGWNINIMCIYDINFENKHYRAIYGPIVSLRKNIELDQSDRKIYYSCTRVTDQYIYGLYLNRQEKDRRYHSGNEEFHIFDWEGNPIMNIVISENIIFFTVDEKNKCLYGLTSDEKIYRYDLTKYLTKL